MNKRTNTNSLPLPDVINTRIDKKNSNTSEQIGRLDIQGEIRNRISPFCRLKYGEIWEDPIRGHRVGVLDSTKRNDVKKIIGNEKTKLIINDPPYNVAVGNANTENLFRIDLSKYLKFSREWVQNVIEIMDENAHLYIWIGTDYKNDFQPLPDFMIMMRNFKELTPRNLITLRNQRGYGTQKNWMWIRQELLYYIKGNPDFSVIYTDIPKVLKGYYKVVDNKLQENIERSKSNTIRPGNVWIDVQQVFYRLEENVSGCYAQKPLKAIERLIMTSSNQEDTVVDFFSHSGTTLIAGEKLKRKIYTFDIDPIYAEISIRRLDHYRKTGETGWQWRNPFPEIEES